MITKDDFPEFFRHYLVAAFWSSDDDGGSSLDENGSVYAD
jgi:hypothetical protein